jgi:hypothetical protein
LPVSLSTPKPRSARTTSNTVVRARSGQAPRGLDPSAIPHPTAEELKVGDERSVASELAAAAQEVDVDGIDHRDGGPRKRLPA